MRVDDAAGTGKILQALPRRAEPLDDAHQRNVRVPERRATHIVHAAREALEGTVRDFRDVAAHGQHRGEAPDVVGRAQPGDAAEVEGGADHEVVDRSIGRRPRRLLLGSGIHCSRRFIRLSLNPRFLSSMASYNVASNIC